MFREFDYDNQPVVDIVNDMLADAIKLGVSDIHLDPTPEHLNVRIRIDGELREYTKVPASVKKNLTTRIKIISGMNITETRLPQDGAIKNLNDETNVDMRVSSLPIVDGEKIVIRLLDYSKSLEGIESLDFTEDNLKKILTAIHNPHGIILISGATGSGKSTTVYGILQRLNDVKRNIITVEDPVEMKIPGINQVQVMSEIGLTFSNTLRSILRQDPDTIMIGEIRDDETARIAVRASITGHLVLSTIHTNNSLTTIERLLDMEIERYLLGSALTMIIAQKLTKRLCPICREKIATTTYQKNIFKKVLGYDVDAIYAPKGCDKCFDGYKGRVAIQEVLLLNQEIKDAITANVDKHTLKDMVYKEENVKTLFQDALMKVINGLTSFDEVLNVIDIAEDIDNEDEELKKLIIGNYNTEEEIKKEEETINQVTPEESSITPTPPIEEIETL